MLDQRLIEANASDLEGLREIMAQQENPEKLFFKFILSPWRRRASAESPGQCPA